MNNSPPSKLVLSKNKDTFILYINKLLTFILYAQ